MPDSVTSADPVVVDVNLLVRGILSGRGGSTVLIRALKQGLFIPIASRPYLQEIYRLLGYPRLLRRYPVSYRQRRRLIAQVYSRAAWVEPATHLALCRDPHDDYLLEMALLGVKPVKIALLAALAASAAAASICQSPRWGNTVSR